MKPWMTEQKGGIGVSPGIRHLKVKPWLDLAAKATQPHLWPLEMREGKGKRKRKRAETNWGGRRMVG